MRHCPSDCHSHIIETFSGVQGGSFDAPDHEYPSHLLLSVDVTDSGGLTTHAEVELQPATGTVGASTSPAGIPITVGPATGTPPRAVTGIVNSTVSVSAPATAVIGESTYAFDHWSDGGARTHGVTIVARGDVGGRDLPISPAAPTAPTAAPRRPRRRSRPGPGCPAGSGAPATSTGTASS